VKVQQLTNEECYRVLRDAGFGRLASARDNQPYVVPIYFVVGENCIYSFAIPGQKIEWMRENPRVCIEVDRVGGGNDWTSVVVFGRYTELTDSSEFRSERSRAHQLLQDRPMWWEPGAVSLEGSDGRGLPIFYRVTIDRITGQRAVPGFGEHAQP